MRIPELKVIKEKGCISKVYLDDIEIPWKKLKVKLSYDEFLTCQEVVLRMLCKLSITEECGDEPAQILR